MENEALIQLTNKICKAVSAGNIGFVKKNIIQSLTLREKFFGKKYKTLVDRSKVFEKPYSQNFQLNSRLKADVFVKGRKAKIVYENPFRIHSDATRFRQGFDQKTFFYVKANENWQLTKVESNMTWFSTNDLQQSFANLIGYIAKRGIIVGR